MLVMYILAHTHTMVGAGLLLKPLCPPLELLFDFLLRAHHIHFNQLIRSLAHKQPPVHAKFEGGHPLLAALPWHRPQQRKLDRGQVACLALFNPEKRIKC